MSAICVNTREACKQPPGTETEKYYNWKKFTVRAESENVECHWIKYSDIKLNKFSYHRNESVRWYGKENQIKH